MFKNLKPQLVGINGLNLDDTIELAIRHGFGGIDLPLSEVAEMEEPTEAKAKLDTAGLQWGLFPIPVNFVAPEEKFQEGLERLRRLAPIAQAVGCTRTYDHVWPGHHEKNYEENFEFHSTRLRLVVSILARYEIRFGIEFIGAKTLRDTFKIEFIHTLEQALELREAVDPDRNLGVGILLDSFHWYTSGGSVEDIRNHLSNDILVGVHVNDARADRSREEQMDLERALPGQTGVIDIAGFVGALSEIGYDGPMTPEPFEPTRSELGQMPPNDAVARVAASMKDIPGLP